MPPQSQSVPTYPVRSSPSPVFTVGKAILRPVLWAIYRPRVVGREHIPESGPVLLVSNHLSAADTILIPSFSPRKVRFLAKASLFSGRFKNWFFTEIGAVPVHREAGSAAQLALNAGRDVLANGQVFAVFPEGTRSRDGLLHRGRTGAAFLALETGATVIPVGLSGSRLTKTAPKSPTLIRFGPPIYLSDLQQLPAGRARNEATERIMTAIQVLTGQKRTTEFATGGRGD